MMNRMKLAWIKLMKYLTQRRGNGPLETYNKARESVANYNYNRIREARERGLGENAIAGVFRDLGKDVEVDNLLSSRFSVRNVVPFRKREV